MLRLHFHYALLVVAAACGSENDDKDPTPDAAATPTDVRADSSMPTIDAPPGSAATVVDCAGVTPAVEVYYQGDTLTPATSQIAVGQVVKFRDLGQHTAWHSEGLWSISGAETGCVRFDGAGSYTFYCYFHQDPDEVGTIVVQ